MLLVVAVTAFAAVLVVRCLPSVADRALELQAGSMNRREQAQQHTSTTAHEREALSDAAAVVVQWSICWLTLVEADMWSEAE